MADIALERLTVYWQYDEYLCCLSVSRSLVRINNAALPPLYTASFKLANVFGSVKTCWELVHPSHCGVRELCINHAYKMIIKIVFETYSKPLKQQMSFIINIFSIKKL